MGVFFPFLYQRLMAARINAPLFRGGYSFIWKSALQWHAIGQRFESPYLTPRSKVALLQSPISRLDALDPALSRGNRVRIPLGTHLTSRPTGPIRLI